MVRLVRQSAWPARSCAARRTAGSRDPVFPRKIAVERKHIHARGHLRFQQFLSAADFPRAGQKYQYIALVIFERCQHGIANQRRKGPL